jgi:hypothetical protein
MKEIIRVKVPKEIKRGNYKYAERKERELTTFGIPLTNSLRIDPLQSFIQIISANHVICKIYEYNGLRVSYM